VHLVVGLGNPGKTYQLTRHNVGFMVVDQLAEIHHIRVTRARFHGLWGRGVIAQHQVVLIKPQTFMNRSGQAVAALMDYFKLSAQELLVIHDDLDVDFGRTKLVRGGGSGGHRGVQSIHEALVETRYVRLKVGIGRPRYNESTEQYVLRPWYEDQRNQVADIVEAAVAAVTAILSEGLDKAMAVVNAKHAPLSAS
jgi:PTH1 family peptidyl-tRNA hydrolase